jgi:hypothetical protein
MNTPRSADGKRHHGRSRNGTTKSPDCGPRSTLFFCLTGGAIVGVVSLLFLPRLFAVTHSFGMLSSTILACTFLFGWVITWGVIEHAVETRYGCL